MGNLSRKVDANGAQVDYTYDGNNRLLKVIYQNAIGVFIRFNIKYEPASAGHNRFQCKPEYSG